MKCFHHLKDGDYFYHFNFLKLKKIFSGTNPQRLHMHSVFIFRGHLAVIPGTFPSHRSLPMLQKKAKILAFMHLVNYTMLDQQGEIPSSLQLVNSYALEPEIDMPCNFLT